MKTEFRILIVEDLEDKAQRVRDLVSEISKPIVVEFTRAVDLISGIRALENSHFDMLILDLMIPAAGGVPSPQNAKALLEQLIEGNLVTPGCVVGLTAFGDLYQTEARYFADNLFSIEWYDLGSPEWVERIGRHVRHMHRWKVSYQRSALFDFNFDLVFVTTRTKGEYEPILEEISWKSGPHQDLILFKGSRYVEGTIDFSSRVFRCAVFCIEEMGLSPSAAWVSQIMAACRPRLIVMLGMCCGFRHENAPATSKLGDVIIVREAACWDEGKYRHNEGGATFVNRAKIRVVEHSVDKIVKSIVESEPELLWERVRGIWQSTHAKRLRKKFRDDVGEKPEVRYGVLVSGSSVVADEVMREEVSRRFTSALGLEMEVYGVYTAAEMGVGAKPLVLAIKGVADFGDGGKHREFQSVASKLSYAVAVPIIGRIL